ncbi:MFS transporter [Gordonia sp. TBRC 11910]|uniref:MFS transporter n=1 Tax=Gordonia asplenii TaxID=2725283 RepID=A0A848KYZ9_9ACTN|nr:MFS transporter [Gordonia asplenii]NMO03816.1 MFS transporter [Gordonia asplenii]
MSSRWGAVAAYSLLGASTQLLWLTFAPITTDAAKHYGVSAGAIGWLANVFPLLYVVLAIPAGIALDRSFRAALTLGSVLTAAGGLLRLVSDQYSAVLAGQLLVAVAQPFVLNAITRVAGGYLAERDRPKGIAVGSAAQFAGMLAAFLMGSVMEFHTLLVAQAAIAVVSAAALVVALRAPALYHRSSEHSGFAAFRETWRDPFVRRLCALVFVPFGTFISLTTWIEALLAPAGVSADQAGIVLIANVIAGVVGSALIPVWATKRRRELWIMLVAVAVTAASCLVLAVAPGFALAVLVFTLFGFLLLPALPIVLELSERRVGASEGAAAGLIWLSGNLGGLIVAGVVGALVDHPAPAFLLMAAVVLAAIPLLRGLRSDVEALPSITTGEHS